MYFSKNVFKQLNNLSISVLFRTKLQESDTIFFSKIIFNCSLNGIYNIYY